MINEIYQTTGRVSKKRSATIHLASRFLNLEKQTSKQDSK